MSFSLLRWGWCGTGSKRATYLFGNFYQANMTNLFQRLKPEVRAQVKQHLGEGSFNWVRFKSVLESNVSYLPIPFQFIKWIADATGEGDILAIELMFIQDSPFNT